jgi:DNA-binding CsgD family transcriptional regulator
VVLRLVALGLTIREIGEQFGTAGKTADHHIQPVHGTIGVTIRGAAARFAIEHGGLLADSQSTR